MQNVFDKSYQQSRKGKRFTNLLDIITAENNILLAYRNIKSNNGCKTSGVDKRNISSINDTDVSVLVEKVQSPIFAPITTRPTSPTPTTGLGSWCGATNGPRRMDGSRHGATTPTTRALSIPRRSACPRRRSSRIIAIITPGVRALNVGGYYGNGTSAGLFYLSGFNAPTDTGTNLASRLQKLPRAA